MGMIGLVIVGDPVNRGAAEAVQQTGLARKRFAALFGTGTDGSSARFP
jgi:hypothetical protein